MRTPIAITGVGVASPAGTTADSFWSFLALQEDARGKWLKRALGEYPVDNVVSMSEDLWREIMEAWEASENRAAALAAWTVSRALQDAGLPVDGRRTGCILASTTAGVEATENAVLARSAGAHRGPPLDYDASTIVPPIFRWSGPTSVISTACSSGLVAPMLAGDALLAGEADAMIAGGIEVLLEYTICGFNALRLATGDRCRPFDQMRKGVVLSEGAVCFCLERLDVAQARGAPIRGVILGSGVSCDADHVTAPDPEGVAVAILEALERSGLGPESVGGVIAHGTGTPVNDVSEIRALRAAFGEVELPPITSIKAVMGHSQAAAGSFSLLAALLALRTGRLPATAGLRTLDPALSDIDVVQAAGPALRKNAVLVNAFGFGGNNCAMVVADQALSSGTG
jgi:3-oxoacyl-[acyl-carrier-protein] synthase II